VRSLSLSAVLVLSACLDGRYVCASSSACVADGVAGTCEPSGFCSFADPSCPAPGRRYGALADAAHRDDCVGADGCVLGLASGGFHSCAVTRGGAAWCWGWNELGQLGNASFANAAVPVAAVDDRGAPFGDVLELDAGYDFTCARRADRTVWCWGNGRRLGAGELANQPSPRQVQADGAALDRVVELAAGAAHACAIRDDRSVWCWGANDAGQLGDAAISERLTASPVRWSDATLFDGATAITAGASFTCTARAAQVWCWGTNMFAQLGQPGGLVSSAAPVVALPTAASALTAGGAHACAIALDGAAWCWGRAGDGQIGRPDLPGIGVAPVTVLSAPDGPPLAQVASIAAGEAHSCASTTDGRVRCWGRGEDGQLGQGALESSATPVDVLRASDRAPLTGAISVSAGIDDYQAHGGRHSCARLRDEIWCWGTGDFGVLGDGQAQGRSLAAPVDLSAACR